MVIPKAPKAEEEKAKVASNTDFKIILKEWIAVARAARRKIVRTERERYVNEFEDPKWRKCSRC